MSTDSISLTNSLTVFTKPGWQSTTEPSFITHNHNHNHESHNIIPHEDKAQTLQWQYTTESGYVTRIKKPSSFKPKNKPTKKPLPSTTNKYATKYGVVKSTTTKR